MSGRSSYAHNRMRVLRALVAGPLYKPLLQYVASLNKPELKRALIGAMAQGEIEEARDIGPNTYRITAKGVATLARRDLGTERDRELEQEA